MSQGKFIVVEGLEGAGKTTAIQTITAELAKHGVTHPVLTREPGSTPLAEALRRLIKEGIPGDAFTAKAELLVLYAARTQLVENVIKPALMQGKWVVGDRHDLSTQAYQGAGRQLDQTFIAQLKQMVLGDFKPDVTFYLDLPPEEGLRRVYQRGTLDQIEKESLSFFQRARARYLDVAHSDNSVIMIDAAKPLNKVNEHIISALQGWLAKQAR